MSYKNSKKQNVSLKGDAEEMVSTFVSDPNVQDDIVFRLGLLSAFSLICSGVSKNDIKRIEMMTATSIFYLVKKYYPDYDVIMSQDPRLSFLFIELFSDAMRSMANSMFLTCLNMDDPKQPQVDPSKIVKIRTDLFGLK